MPPEADRTDRELQMMETMVDCAHALGMAFGNAARTEADTTRSLELFDAFQKSFLAVRMGIRLSLALRAAPKAAADAAASRPEHEAERDPPERERAEAAERERDRDYEPVSLPRFLAALGVVARDASRLGDRLPAEAAAALPPLRDLLARATTAPPAPKPAPARAAGVAVLARPPQSGTRQVLLGSTTSLPRPGPRTHRPWSGSG